jgi:hypothetical protein
MHVLTDVPGAPMPRLIVARNRHCIPQRVATQHAVQRGFRAIITVNNSAHVRADGAATVKISESFCPGLPAPE